MGSTISGEASWSIDVWRAPAQAGSDSAAAADGLLRLRQDEQALRDWQRTVEDMRRRSATQPLPPPP